MCLQGYAESARDFTRAFSGCSDGNGDILLVEADSGAGAGPQPVICTTQTGGNVNDDIVAKATAEFRSSVVAAALQRAGIYVSPKRLAHLSAQIIGNLTVGAAMDALLASECVPQMFQNKYCVLVSGSSVRQEESVRVLTYGFIGSPESGDRPDMKYTPFMLRLLTENLLEKKDSAEAEAGGAGQKIAMIYVSTMLHTPSPPQCDSQGRTRRI